MLSLARNIPQAHGSLTAGKWERSKFGGVEVYEKMLGVLGFGRIGQLVATRARGFGMRVVAYDPFVSAERYRELGVEKAETSADVYAQADFITIHLPKTPETRGWLNAEAFAQMKDGVRVINCARGELVDDAALKDALDSGKVAGAALDVFPSEPITDYPLFDGYPNVVVTPHLGASTTEAQDRAGVQTAEQVVAALTGGVVSTAVNIPAVERRGHGGARPVPAALPPARPARDDAGGEPGVERVEVEYLGRIAERDTRLLTIAVAQRPAGRAHRGGGQLRQRALAGRGARDRGLRAQGGRRARLHRPRAHHASSAAASACGSSAPRSAGCTARTCSRPGASASTSRWTTSTSRCSATATCPGMVGRVGTCFGEHGMNISTAAVGRQSPGDDGGAGPTSR